MTPDSPSGLPRIVQSVPLMLLLPILCWLSVAAPPALAAAEAAPLSSADIRWVVGEGPDARVQLYFYWSKTCPHCRAALPFLIALDQDNDWLEVQSFELTGSRANVGRYIAMAAALGQEARSVPAFFLCGRMLTGFDSAGGMGDQLRRLAGQCRPDGGASGAPDGPQSGPSGGEADPAAAPALSATGTAGAETTRLRVPVLGELDAKAVSLPLFTLVIAGLDAFNPCAFFVLLFLLSLMVHARSRARMLLVGGTFVFFSGLVYFLFMAAWLNLFLVIGGAPVVTIFAGGIAVVIGLLNVKDFAYFGEGPSLSIPEQAKPGLYRRMRGLVGADRLPTMLLGTVALALAANSYELLCTAGFPMVYTRVLTLNGLTGWGHYAYLALYNLIYVLPLLAIVLAFTFTLGTRKLSERQGRLLKLLSGVMMLGLGTVMLVAPDLLSNPWVGAGLLLAAAVITAVAALATKAAGRAPA